MEFIKIKCLPNGEEQLINISQVKRIRKNTSSSGIVKHYELMFSGADIKISPDEAKKIFKIIGIEF